MTETTRYPHPRRYELAGKITKAHETAAYIQRELAKIPPLVDEGDIRAADSALDEANAWGAELRSVIDTEIREILDEIAPEEAQQADPPDSLLWRDAEIFIARLDLAAADSEMYGQHLERALQELRRAAEESDHAAMSSAYGRATEAEAQLRRIVDIRAPEAMQALKGRDAEGSP